MLEGGLAKDHTFHVKFSLQSSLINMEKIKVINVFLEDSDVLDRNAIWEKLQGCGKKNIIHMANGSDEDDTVDGDDIFIIFSIFSKTGKSFEGGRIQCICHEIRSSSLASRDSQLRRVCGLTIRFKM